ncbi:uncharacterized protein SPSK_03806 [Sporothrix schenckii 1099-18]|uniref:Uncharacterized protein n=1 Tax=Sporothrix schenckii 1099-18 TaxID=1397361 RepID=A0A0F2M164_SPOSC|nr:uncharacterized protein SPSK_03806 [Sporothrix schenckii 1099-18]KJR81911.1 hypothetical protein SPSK_03806 [Sporothrix schenckii 1099-18]
MKGRARKIFIDADHGGFPNKEATGELANGRGSAQRRSQHNGKTVPYQVVIARLAREQWTFVNLSAIWETWTDFVYATVTL